MPRVTQVEQATDLCRAADWEAKRLELPPDWKTNRPLVAGLTIDGPTTRDRDDAIAIGLSPEVNGAHQVRISIADVGSFLGAGQAPAIEAYAQHMGETRYLPGRNKPMIPRRISEHLLSILPSHQEPETPVISIVMDILPGGGVGGIGLQRERLRPTALTYDEVAMLSQGLSGRENQAIMRKYEQVAKRLRKNRMNGDGLVPSRTPDGPLVDKGDDSRSHPASQPGELIVSEFMILANTAIAEFMFVNNIPGLYRNHQLRGDLSQDQLELLGDYALAENGHVLDRAYYSTSPEGHASLRLPDAYCHFTSPLRRFADFVNHANLAAFLDGRDYPYQGEDLQSIAEHLNSVQANLREQRLRRQQAIARPLGANAVNGYAAA